MAVKSKGSRNQPQRRAPHVAERVAEELRKKILDGHLPNGAKLPKQDDLIEQFGVSRPSVREALRILEAEGLVRVRRGKVGGATVHPPEAANVAYTMGLILRSGKVSVDDVSTALKLIEPVCASLCAKRPDRATEVIPLLRAVHEAATACIDDPEEFTVRSRQFHEHMVASCGNDTLILVIGALETVWSGHASAWAEKHIDENKFPDRDYRQMGLDDHTRLLEAIEIGDAEAAAQLAESHLDWSPVYSIDEENQIVPSLLRPNLPD